MGVIGLLVPIAVIALIVIGVRKVVQKGGGVDEGGHGVRRFFQYLLLFVLLIISAIGLGGLLGRLLGGETLVDLDQAGLARSLTFTVIGLPLYLAVAYWSRRRMADDPEELRSLGWAFYLTAASIVALIVTMFALSDILEWLFQVQDYDGDALARLVVWGAVWGLHWAVDMRVRSETPTRVHHLIGSTIGLGTVAAGLSRLLAEALELIIFPGSEMIAGDRSALLGSVATVIVGGAVWSLYWLATASREERNPLWNGYVLVAGVAAGLITAISAATALLHTVLVWLVGDPGTTSATRHFGDVPEMLAATAVGLAVWWYHHAVLDSVEVEKRTEPRRIYEYLMAAIGLMAAAAGLTTLLVALIEAVAGTSGVLVGEGATNTLLAALVLLVVGAPVWWFFWRRIQRTIATDPAGEHASPTRRIYLFLLFGVGGVAAVIAVIVGVFIFFEDLFEDALGVETLRSARFALGALVTTGAIAAYHWTVYRSDRELAPAVSREGPRFVLLVGEPGTEFAREVARRTGGRVTSWPRTDGTAAPWSIDEVMAALGTAASDEVMVVSGSDGLTVVPIRRN
jgi:hypothetical protein